MTVRAYPDTFGDREDTASEEILETNDRVTSSGYIRLVAARLGARERDLGEGRIRVRVRGRG